MGSREKGFAQDLLVSIRYRNDLPPPPMPPKLLDIQTEGVRAYLDHDIPLSLARKENHNIELDAELGMPIDVLGMYGYFDGDETSIMAPSIAPPLDPEDEALLLTAEQLRAGTQASTSTFLRKTQYMTSSSGLARDVLSSKPSQSQPRPRRQSTLNVELARDSKDNIVRSIERAFELAYPTLSTSTSTSDPSLIPTAAEKAAWATPRHPLPSKSHLKPVSYHPITPDLTSTTARGLQWDIIRFDKPPLPALKHPHRRDNRLDAAMLGAQLHPEKSESYFAAKEAWEKNPDEFAEPGPPPVLWSMLIPAKDGASVSDVKTVFNENIPATERNEALARVGVANKDGEMVVPFSKTRFYPDSQIGQKTPEEVYRTLVFTINQTDIKNGKGGEAHYYPVGQTAKLKAGASKTGPGGTDLEEGFADEINLRPVELGVIDRHARTGDRAVLDPGFAGEYEVLSREVDMLKPEEEEKVGNDQEVAADEQVEEQAQKGGEGGREHQGQRREKDYAAKVDVRNGDVYESVAGLEEMGGNEKVAAWRERGLVQGEGEDEDMEP